MKTALFVMAKDEDNYIDEFLDYYIKLGFDDIFIYQNNWRANLKTDFNGKVHLIEFDVEAPQVPGMNHFIQNHYSEYDWAAFFDVDEFLLLKKHTNIKDFLEEYSEFPAIGVNMRLFGDSGHKKVIDGNYSVINRFTHSDDKLFSLVKLFLNFRLGKNQFRLFNPHIVNCKAVDPNKKRFTTNGNFFDNNDDEIAELAHFRNKSYEECLKRKFKNTDVCYGYLDKIKDADSSGRTNLEIFNKEYEEHNKNNIENSSIKDFYEKISIRNDHTPEIPFEDNTRIFVLTHSLVNELQPLFHNKFFTPLCCGAEIAKNEISGTLYDNVGENISKYNRLVNDPTGVFYIGAHLDELMEEKEYVGIMQYSKGFKINPKLIGPKVVYAAFLLNGKTVYEKFGGYAYFDTYVKEFSKRLGHMFPQYTTNPTTSFDAYLNQKISIHFNMFLVHKQLFKQWFNILKDGYRIALEMIDENYHNDFKDILDVMKQKQIEINGYTIHDHKRIYAYLLEVFSGYAFFYLTNGYSKDYKYIAAQFFGFDGVKKVIKDKEASMEVNNG